MQKISEFVINLTWEHLLNVRNLNIIWFYLKAPKFFFSLTFFTCFRLEIFVSLFSRSGLLHFFTRVIL